MKVYSFCPLCAHGLLRTVVGARERLYCPVCSWVHYLNPLPATIAYTLNNNNELLVVKRAHEPAINEWSLPGGFLEAGEDPHEGCLRELMEETSLKGEIDCLIGIYNLEVKHYGSVLVVAYKVRVSDDMIAINHELHDGGFFSLHRMPEIRIPLHIQIMRDGESKNFSHKSYCCPGLVCNR